jgi:hypothetical protein
MRLSLRCVYTPFCTLFNPCSLAIAVSWMPEWMSLSLRSNSSVSIAYWWNQIISQKISDRYPLTDGES